MPHKSKSQTIALIDDTSFSCIDRGEDTTSSEHPIQAQISRFYHVLEQLNIHRRKIPFNESNSQSQRFY